MRPNMRMVHYTWMLFGMSAMLDITKHQEVSTERVYIMVPGVENFLCVQVCFFVGWAT